VQGDEILKNRPGGKMQIDIALDFQQSRFRDVEYLLAERGIMVSSPIWRTCPWGARKEKDSTRFGRRTAPPCRHYHQFFFHRIPTLSAVDVAGKQSAAFQIAELVEYE
jgi:hypothetical protein